jgi:hypothetical protein
MTVPQAKQPMVTTIQSYEFSAQDFHGLLRDALAKGASLRFAAAGCSMDPFIKDGDVVTVAPLPRQIKPGQIAAAVSPANGLVIIHRVVRVKEGAVLLKGDNLERPDGWVRGDALLGIVAVVERGGVAWQPGITRHAALIALLSRWDMLRAAARVGAILRRLIKRNARSVHAPS